MTKHFHLGQYIRHDRNVWYSPCQVVVTDEIVIARLEAEYQAHQRQHKGPRPPFVAHDGHYSGPPVRRKGLVTPREKRANGRAE